MSNMEIFLIAASFLIGFGFVAYIRAHDKHEKEPYKTMILVTILGGIFSMIVCLFLYVAYDFLIGYDSSKIIRAFIVIGPIEEAAKLFTLFVFYYFLRKEINEPLDGMVYLACIVLGFSLIENYFYATKTPDSYDLLFWRVLLSTPTHITDSILMGLGFYVWTLRKQRYGFLVLAYIYACLIHGLFDAAVFMESEWAPLPVLTVMFISLYIGNKAINYGTAVSPFRLSIKEFMASIVEPEIVPDITCTNCRDKKGKLLYKHWYFDIHQCDNCKNVLLSNQDLILLFSFFTSTEPDAKEIESHFNQKIYDPTIKYAYDLKKLHQLIEIIHKQHIDSVTSKFLPIKLFIPPEKL